ncbi:hypothetical protein IIA79_05970, partial [bacterium]|nr:hypothetical protein [bacterium]
DLDPGAYTVTPSKATFTFAPESQGVNIVDADVFNVDFVGVVEVESVTYTDDMRPAVFVPVCMQCHDSNKFGGERQGAPPGVNFDTFAAAAASANRGNIRSQAGTMPPGGPLTDDQKALFQQWMDDGILE